MIERVLTGVGVVALADADGHEPEPAGTSPARPCCDSRTSSVSAVAPRAIASCASASSNRVPMPWRCNAGSTAIVVTWPSLSDIIKPGVADDVATDLARRSTRASIAARARSRRATCVHGRGYTCASMRSTERRCRRRIGDDVHVERLERSPAAAITPPSGPTRSRRRSCGRYIGSTSPRRVNSSRSYRPTASSASAARLGAACAGPASSHDRSSVGELRRRSAARRRRTATRPRRALRARPRARRACRARTPTPVARRRARSVERVVELVAAGVDAPGRRAGAAWRSGYARRSRLGIGITGMRSDCARTLAVVTPTRRPGEHARADADRDRRELVER